MLLFSIMSNVERRPLPDGRIRIFKPLAEPQKEALRALRINGLTLLNINETEISQPETWIEYWFDKDKITEDELRAEINRTIISSH